MLYCGYYVQQSVLFMPCYVSVVDADILYQTEVIGSCSSYDQLCQEA